MLSDIVTAGKWAECSIRQGFILANGNGYDPVGYWYQWTRELHNMNVITTMLMNTDCVPHVLNT